MRNRAFLPLMEQICMIAVFAIISVLCIQGFTLAYRISNQQERKDHAVLEAQNAVETLKSTFGDLDKSVEQNGGYHIDGNWYISYNENWEQVEDAEQAKYVLVASILRDENVFLGGADIQVICGEEVLFALTVYWQEGNV